QVHNGGLETQGRPATEDVQFLHHCVWSLCRWNSNLSQRCAEFLDHCSPRWNLACLRNIFFLASRLPKQDDVEKLGSDLQKTRGEHYFRESPRILSRQEGV